MFSLKNPIWAKTLLNACFLFACCQASTCVGNGGLDKVTGRFSANNTELTLVPLFNAVP